MFPQALRLPLGSTGSGGTARYTLIGCHNGRLAAASRLVRGPRRRRGPVFAPMPLHRNSTSHRIGRLLLVACLAAFGCSKSSAKPDPKKGPGGRGPASFPVEVMAAEARQVEYSVSAVGSVDAFEQVQVTARVAGAVEAVRFAEGDVVKKGAPLIEIEVQRYNLAVRSAQASVERARAARMDAESILSRREKGAAEGIATQEDLQTARTKVATATADVATAESALSLAQLNLRDAYVRAPIDGTIQTRTVTTGQYVQPGTVLATLVKRDPLLLRFQVPEHESAELKPKMVARFKVRGLDRELTAEISSVAQSADMTTRMVQVVGQVSAPPPELRPGAFAEVTVPIGAKRDAPVIPQTAVRPSERGFLSFVIQDGKAQERVLELGLRTTDGLVEVKKGVVPGDAVVVRGAEALSDGVSVRIVPPGGAGVPGSAPAAQPPGPPTATPAAPPPAASPTAAVSAP
jgi:RND family efflux transporter MFP subunit